MCHKAFVVVEPRADGTCVTFHPSLDHGLIAAVGDDFLPMLHENLLHITAFGKDHEARGVAVETMNRMRADRFVAALEVFVEDALDVVLTSFERCIGEDAWGFIDNDEEGVLIDNVYKRVVQTMNVAATGNLDELSCLQRGVVLRGDDFIDIDHALRQQLLGTGTVAASHDGQQKVHQLLGLTHMVVGVMVGLFAVVIVLRSLFVISAHFRE